MMQALQMKDWLKQQMEEKEVQKKLVSEATKYAILEQNIEITRNKQPPSLYCARLRKKNSKKNSAIWPDLFKKKICFSYDSISINLNRLRKRRRERPEIRCKEWQKIPRRSSTR